MRKPGLIALLLIGVTVVGYAQIGNSRADMDMIFNDLNKKYSLDKRYPQVEGSPFLFDTYKVGILKMTDGKILTRARMNIDLVTQDLIVLNGQNVGVIVSPDQVTSLELESKIFRNGFPALENQTPQSFYEVMIQDTVSLLKYYQKSIVQLDEFDKGKKKFQLYEDYYFLYNNTMNSLKTKTLNKAFPQMKDDISAFIKSNDLKLKEDAGAKKLVEFINTRL